MATDNEAFQTGQAIERLLNEWRSEVMSVDASDTGCRERAVRAIEEARRQLRIALKELAGLV